LDVDLRYEYPATDDLLEQLEFERQFVNIYTHHFGQVNITADSFEGTSEVEEKDTD
jgi:hypothetical protein